MRCHFHFRLPIRFFFSTTSMLSRVVSGVVSLTRSLRGLIGASISLGRLGQQTAQIRLALRVRDESVFARLRGTQFARRNQNVDLAQAHAESFGGTIRAMGQWLDFRQIRHLQFSERVVMHIYTDDACNSE